MPKPQDRESLLSWETPLRGTTNGCNTVKRHRVSPSLTLSAFAIVLISVWLTWDLDERRRCEILYHERHSSLEPGLLDWCFLPYLRRS